MSQSLEHVRHAYDAASQVYAQQFIDELDHKPFDRKLLARFAARVGAKETVLDLGCGPGHTTAYLDGLGLRATGIDLSPVTIEGARLRFPQSRFEPGNLLALAAANTSTAGILGFYCIVHLRPEQLLPAFQEMHRILRPGGTILLSFHVGDETIRAENFLESGATLEFTFFPVAAVGESLAQAGFVDLEIHQRPPYPSEHPSTRCYIFARRAPGSLQDS